MMIRKALKQGFNLTLQNWPLILIQILLNGTLVLALWVPIQLGKTYFLSKLEEIFRHLETAPHKAVQEFLELVKENLDILLFLGLYLFFMLLIWDILWVLIQGGTCGIFKEALLVEAGFKPAFMEEDRQQTFPFFTQPNLGASDYKSATLEVGEGFKPISTSSLRAFRMGSFIKYAGRFFLRLLALQAWLALFFMLLLSVLLASSSLALYLLDQSEKLEQLVGLVLSGLGLALFFIFSLFMILAVPYATIIIVLEDTTSLKGLLQSIRFVVDYIGGVLGLFFIFLGLLLVMITTLELGERTADYLGSALSEKNPLFKLVFLVLTYLTWSFFQSFIQLFNLGTQMSYYVRIAARAQPP